jgi:hypothetical protein
MTTVKQHTATKRQSERALIEELRARVDARKAQQPARPTVEQVTIIVTDIGDGIDLGTTGSKMGRSTHDAGEKMVLDVVATFGTWLAHSIGRAEVDYLYAADQDQPQLFATADQAGKVIIPVGYEPAGRHRRDLDKALCTIIAHKPGTEVITRFVARTYTARQSRLSYPVIAGLWGFTQRGRLETIDLVSDDLIFQTQVLEAFDLLDVSREDAIKAVRILLGKENPSPKHVLATCDRAYWLDESGFQTLRRAAEAASRSKDLTNRIEREVELLRRRVELRPSHFAPADVASLTLGQVRRICENAGIRVEPENRAEEAEIRATLKAMGFAVDADRLVPEALRCAEQGMLDEFWEIMNARKGGDPSWSTQLQELAATTA